MAPAPADHGFMRPRELADVSNMPLRGSKTTTVEAKQPAAAAEAAADVAAPKAQTAEQPAAPEAPAEEEVAVGGAAGETPIAALAALLDLGHEGLCNLLSNHQAARFALLAALDSCAPVGPRAPGPHEQAVQRVLAAVPEPTDEIDIFYLDYVARRVDRAAEPLCYWGWRSAATGDDGDDRAAPALEDEEGPFSDLFGEQAEEGEVPLLERGLGLRLRTQSMPTADGEAELYEAVI